MSMFFKTLIMFDYLLGDYLMLTLNIAESDRMYRLIWTIWVFKSRLVKIASKFGKVTVTSDLGCGRSQFRFPAGSYQISKIVIMAFPVSVNS